MRSSTAAPFFSGKAFGGSPRLGAPFEDRTGRKVSRGVLRSVHACLTFLLECFALDHACCLPHSAKQNGLREVTFLFRRGSGSPVVRSQIDGAVIGFRGFTSGLCVSLWRSRRRTKGTRGTESAARQSAFLRDRIGFVMFSAGSPLGAARPQTCAKEPSALWTLFIWFAAEYLFVQHCNNRYL